MTLLVSKIFADHHYATFAANDFALVADLLHAWINLHANFLLLVANELPRQLLVPVNNSTLCKVIWTELYDHTVSRQDSNVVLSHLSTDMCQDLVSIC